MPTTQNRLCLLVFAATIAVVAPLNAQSLEQIEAALESDPLKRAYFGETHVHTAYSLDAYIGGARLTPSDAYRFAKGQTVTINGKPHKIGRPLDFAAISDHAEFIGEMFSAQNASAPGHDQPALDELRNLSGIEEQNAWFQKWVISNMRSGAPTHPPFWAGPETTVSGWEVQIEAAREHYQPGTFSTLIGFEWTSAPNAGNMHRNILFRGDQNLPDAPISALDTADEEKLWDWMAKIEANGARLLAIPHNSNGSKGLMFEPLDNKGNPLDKDYAKRRQHFERAIEMMQIKGNSEVHRKLWPSDEFADFENADSINSFSERKLLPQNFVRWALIEGLAYQASLGENPWKLGFAGGTDNHNGAPSDVAEDNYIGSHGPFDSTVEARRKLAIEGWLTARESNPGSLMGVWAPKNTRGAIWDAIHRRETFATSGPRIAPRFFGGAGLKPPQSEEDLVGDGYAQGVPMGGDLTDLQAAPSFTVFAQRDPLGANLDRIQIIKGWVDADGKHQERIVDVAASEGRNVRADGTLSPVGNTVDVEKSTWSNTIGAPSLMGHWTDDRFDPTRPAVYYMRVLEIPTPRWTTYDAAREGLPLLADVPATIQERAWSSPIWYTPGQSALGPPPADPNGLPAPKN